MERLTMLEDLDAALAWFGKRSPTMPGAQRMYRAAYAALKALKVDYERLEGLSREELVDVIHYLRWANINRGRLIDELEAENQKLKGEQ